MTRTQALTLSATLRLAQDEDRWTPRDATRDSLNGLERQLCLDIQPGQPALTEAQDRLIDTYARAVLDDARADYAACRIAAPTMTDIALFAGRADVVACDLLEMAALPRAA